MKPNSAGRRIVTLTYYLKEIYWYLKGICEAVLDTAVHDVSGSIPLRYKYPKERRRRK